MQNQLRLKELGRQQAKVQLYQSLFQLTAGIAHDQHPHRHRHHSLQPYSWRRRSAGQRGAKRHAGARLLQQQLTDIKEGTELVESSLRRVALLVTRFKS